MNVIKRNGEEVAFDNNKIEIAISKANNKVEKDDKLDESIIGYISKDITDKCETLNRSINVEEIQDMAAIRVLYLSLSRFLLYR